MDCKIRIAIVGSRDFKDAEVIRKTLDSFTYLNHEVEIITGGARGVDNIVETFCKQIGLPCKIIRPINPANKLDYLYRNVEIITLADKVIVFWDRKSRGSKFVIDYAKARGKDLEIIFEVKG